MMNTYGIYALADEQGRIVAVNSEGIRKNLDGWTRVGEYESDRPYAQGNFLPGGLLDDRGICRYRLVDGEITERTPEEMDADVTPPMPQVSDTDLALIELASIVAEQQAALVELAMLIGESVCDQPLVINAAQAVMAGNGGEM